jgi:hypothetical protein
MRYKARSHFIPCPLYLDNLINSWLRAQCRVPGQNYFFSNHISITFIFIIMSIIVIILMNIYLCDKSISLTGCSYLPQSKNQFDLEANNLESVIESILGYHFENDSKLMDEKLYSYIFLRLAEQL